MEEAFDAYRVLQVDPFAEPWVVSAAFRALARRYHPDGITPDPMRMAAINRAYAMLRTPELRAAHDRARPPRMRPVGPGAPFSERAADRGGGEQGRVVLDFGRYAGWPIHLLAKHDPDYLRWLCRHSSGLRYRAEIQQHLGFEPDLQRRASSVS